MLFGLPSLRIRASISPSRRWRRSSFSNGASRGLPWLYNYNDLGAIEVETKTLFGLPVTGPPPAAYALLRGALHRRGDGLDRLEHRARPHRPHVDGGQGHGHRGRLIGIRLLRAKLLAFAVSSFYIGVAGAMMVFLWLGAAEPEAFNINLSFQLLFMVVIGGLGSIVGAFFGATIIHLLPIALRALPAMIGLNIASATIDHLTFIVTGALIILS